MEKKYVKALFNFKLFVVLFKNIFNEHKQKSTYEF